MGTKITISDDLAAVLEARREQGEFASLDAAAEAAIMEGIVADDHADDRSIDELQALIGEADASGAKIAWDAKSARAEVLRRYRERGGRG